MTTTPVRSLMIAASKTPLGGEAQVHAELLPHEVLGVVSPFGRVDFDQHGQDVARSRAELSSIFLTTPAPSPKGRLAVIYRDKVGTDWPAFLIGRSPAGMHVAVDDGAGGIEVKRAVPWDGEVLDGECWRFKAPLNLEERHGPQRAGCEAHDYRDGETGTG